MGIRQIRRLSCVGTGEKVRLASIEAGRGLAGRLASMGLVANTPVSMVRNSHPGPVVISVRSVKVVLGQGMAEKIMVY